MELYESFIQPGDLCFDVGANIGKRTDIFLALGAKVICIEPQPELVNILTEKYHGNPDVVLIPKGLAKQTSVMTLSLCESANTIATFSERWKQGRFKGFHWGSTVDVPMTTLDSLVEEYGKPVFCKIDVEGFEYEVLSGLSNPIPLLSFEFTKEFLDTAQLCLDYCESLGKAEYNYTHGSKWTSADKLIAELRRIDDPLLWGDIYVRFNPL